MNDDDTRSTQFVFIGLTLAALLAAISLIIIATTHGHELLSGWLLVVFQLVVAIIVLIFTVAGLHWVLNRVNASVRMMNTTILQRIADVEREYKVELEAIRRQTTPLIAGFLLVGQTLISLTDKAIVGSPITKICVFLGFTVWFWIASNQATQENKTKRLIGIIMWFMGVIAMPWVLAAYYQLGIPDLLSFLFAMDTIVKIYFASTVLILLSLPLLFKSQRGTS